ncbi:tRNA lysidine(34) synthetase TilS [Blastopirellula sp. J2-11]|uniref:tRNA lysidine(34) synthetase TilS n=1 Tax=Blastopirellula sp. J2-11 TaxID=2943192 RepID=UPI0021C8B319|nr:tRNA lysidine(34) synthetase TilS [Blastopirellula sp. J2-11]UUO08599.1 tRNA lysidine(34) synthetase TilS [Blastopirellula sp. J2-11]
MHLFEKVVAASWPPSRWADCTVLVAVSGGADSVALLRSLAAIQESGPGRLVAVHVDHNLREESNADAQFVAQLAQQLGIEAIMGRVDFELSGPDGIEAAARSARYDFLRTFAMDSGARYVVTGHTADDQIETVLQRILRGTSIAGLSAIPRARELEPGISLLRPLLSIRRSEVEAYLADLGQDFRHDGTNDESCFFRNRLRNELLPLLREAYLPQVDQSLLRLAIGAAECREYVESQASQLLAACLLQATDEQVVLDAKELGDASPFLAKEACVLLWRQRDWPRQAMSREKWEALSALIAGDSPAPFELPGGVRAEKKGEQLLLTPLS